MVRHHFFLILFLMTFVIPAQSQTKRALFLGNSYTFYNQMPSLTAEVALSMGDTLVVESNTPGGYTLEGHSANASSLTTISDGGWDFVILQEQSQRPSLPIAQVESDVFPYAELLDQYVYQFNECAETVFYMTWGRENGDASNCPNWPPVCTYDGMDSLLALRYDMMAEMNSAILSPVGAVWRELRENSPEIDLYASDGSHPSVIGSYAAAVTFYTIMYREDPSLIPFNHTLETGTAEIIRTAVHDVVYENLLQWHIGEYDLSAEFDYAMTDIYTYEFSSTTNNSTGIEWSWGDSEEAIITVTFPGPGDYVMVLTAFNDCDTVISSQTINVLMDPNALSEIEGEQTIDISSPVGDQLLLPESLVGLDLSLISISGRLVKSQGDSVNNTWDVSNLPAGIYILLGENDKGQRFKGQFQKL